MKRNDDKGPKNFVLRISRRQHGNGDIEVAGTVIPGTPPKVGYYSDDVRWDSVPREQATRMSHKRANLLLGKIKRCGYACVVEPVQGSH